MATGYTEPASLEEKRIQILIVKTKIFKYKYRFNVA